MSLLATITKGKKQASMSSLLLIEISAAAELQEQLNALASADGNLSVKGAISEAIRQGGKTAEADKVIAAIEADDFDGRQIKGAFTRLAMCVRNFARTSVIRPDRMTGYLGDAGEALARIGVNRASLMLAVIRVLTTNEKHLWGTQDSPTAHAARLLSSRQSLRRPTSASSSRSCWPI